LGDKGEYFEFQDSKSHAQLESVYKKIKQPHASGRNNVHNATFHMQMSQEAALYGYFQGLCLCTGKCSCSKKSSFTSWTPKHAYETRAEINLDSMTFSMSAGRNQKDWITNLRRCDARCPVRKTWCHQDGDVKTVRVKPNSIDYALVYNAAFERKRRDDKTPLLNTEKYEIASIHRIQHRRKMASHAIYEQQLGMTRGESNVQCSNMYMWHGTRRNHPRKVVETGGLQSLYGTQQALYGQGVYTAYQSSYSLHTNFVYRTTDEEGLCGDANGK